MLLPFISQPFFIPSVLFLILSVPLILRLIPPNKFVGVRIKATLADKTTWYRVNGLAGIFGIIASCIYLSVMMLFPYNSEFSIFLIHLAAFAGPWAVFLLFLKSNIESKN